MRPLLTVAALAASITVVVATHAPRADAAKPLSSGSLTMVSTQADGTSGPQLPSTFGADQEAISEDGKVIAFVSPVPAEQLVTDPLQVNHVTDTNGVADVFVWDSRVPSPIGPIVSLVSWNKTHTATADGLSQHPIMAPAGLGVVFESGGDDLVTVPVGSNSKHIYAWAPVVSDLFPVFMVDENFANSAGSDSVASDPSIAISVTPPSARIAFTSPATDLVDPAVHNSHGVNQVYVRTLTLPTPSTEMASVGLDGTGTASGAQDPMIAADGIHVGFDSGGDDLVNGVNATGGNIFVRNLLTSATALISKGNATSQGTTGNSEPAISADGSAIAWESNDPNLSAVTHNGNNHIFYRRGNGDPQMVDTDYLGVIGCNVASNNPGLSLDGSTVVFESNCSDIVPPSISDTTGTDVFARRMSTVPGVPDLAPKLVSINDAGTASGNADSFICPGSDPPHCGASTNPGVTVNADGTAITFFGASNDIAVPPAGTPPFSSGNVFVRYPDFTGGGKTVNLTVSSAGKQPDDVSRDPVISADGGSVAFVSLADDFGLTDTNGATDIFESDLHDSFVIEPINAVNEGDGAVTIAIDRIGNNGTTDSVEVKTGDGSTPDLPTLPAEITNPGNSNAVAPGDYTDTDKTLTFGPGETTKTFTVDITDDSVHEDPELFHVSMSSGSGAGSVALPGPLSEAYVVILDDDAGATAPDVTVNQAAGQADPTSTSPVEFTATFTEPVTGFSAADVDLSTSTAGGTLLATVTGGPTLYTIDVSGMTTSGDVIATVPAGAATDAASNPSTASTSSDNTVAWQAMVDTTDPDVTVNQAAGQADPTSTSPVEFTATFTEPVTGFSAADVDLSTSTAGGTLLATVTGGPTLYTIDVSGMTTSGDVIATVPAGAATDAASNPSTASTSSDGAVVWQAAAKTASHVALALTPTTAVYGQAAHAIATITVDAGTPAGTVQFAVDGTDLGSPVTVSGSTADSPFLTGTGGAALAPGSRSVTATFTPSDPATYAGSNSSTALVVGKAATTAALTITGQKLVAHVAPEAPGAGTPSGAITFLVDGVAVGTADLVSGVATLGHHVPNGKARQVGASYPGDAHFTASSVSTARKDPSITAVLSSAHPASHGWYRGRVTVSFHCVTHGAPLVNPCPASTAFTHDGGGQALSRTIAAVNGGLATVVVHASLDKLAPSVQVTGVHNGGRYTRPGPAARCVAADSLSGVASCVLTRHTSAHGDTDAVSYTATAEDRAGNTRTIHGHYRLALATITAAPYAAGAYTVHRGHTYELVVHSTKRPAYYDAAPLPTVPFRFDQKFSPAGTNRWVLPVTMTQKLHVHIYWNIGIKIGSTMHVLKIRAIT